MGNKIHLSWYAHRDVTAIARLLLGKNLCTNFNGCVSKGRIVETEAYSGTDDKACHANNQRKTGRNKVMFETGGRAYIYLCYGIHHLFNVVTNVEGSADAVLIRALEPIEGVGTMLKRRKMDNCTKNAISNILYKYCIEKNESNFNKIAEVWLKKDIDIYRTIFQIINNCLIVDENTNYITIFIDSEQHRDL